MMTFEELEIPMKCWADELPEGKNISINDCRKLGCPFAEGNYLWCEDNTVKNLIALCREQKAALNIYHGLPKFDGKQVEFKGFVPIDDMKLEPIDDPVDHPSH